MTDRHPTVQEAVMRLQQVDHVKGSALGDAISVWHIYMQQIQDSQRHVVEAANKIRRLEDELDAD